MYRNITYTYIKQVSIIKISMSESPPSSVTDSNFINDIRQVPDFKGQTFSNYKKTEVRTQLIQSILKEKVEHANYWAAELICAGCFQDLWEFIFYFLGKHIHLANPKLVVYIESRIHLFRNIFNQGLFINELELRNDDKIRKLFAEIITIFVFSPKKNSIETIKINREEEFDMTQMTERLKAPTIHYIEPIFQKEDPKELFIACNEFAYHICPDEKQNMLFACYWLEWVIDFDLLCRKRKHQCLCNRRLDVPVEHKYQRDIIWIIWDILFYSIKKKEPEVGIKHKLLHAIYQIFCIKYTTTVCKKRKYLLYYAIAIITEFVPTNIEMIHNKEHVSVVVGKIGEIYKQIKKNEISPKTDYLFRGLEGKNETLMKSVKQLQIMNQIQHNN